MNSILHLILITLLPFLELRASIPYGVLYTELHWSVVFLICVIVNIILGILIFLFLEWIIKIITMIKPIEKIWNKYVERVQTKMHKATEKYGEWAVAVFIGIPLPGSGVYSGALASYLIGLDFKKFLAANIIGVLIAGVIVTIISVTGAEAFSIFLKMM
ncbi:MAG: small multi-drug export protein [Nanoarchaeota archaeon]|nr:small multi-drug export protein [Nanoarchaeota archaeon]